MSPTSGHDASADPVRGFAAPGFEGLRTALASAWNLDERGGGAVSVFQGGRQVAQYAVGSAGASPRTAATSQVVFSCTKGVIATALLLLIERGQLELDAPMSAYWPEFGAAGKDDVTVRHVVSHMSGQPSFRAPVTPDALTDDEFVESVVASDEAWWPAGETIAYQSISYGALCGGLIRRVSGISAGAFVRREIAVPLGLDFWIGLPEDREGDVAPLHVIPVEEQAEAGESPAQQAQVGNPRVLHAPGDSLWNTRAYHAAEMPGVNGIGTATALARLYGCLANGGTIDGRQLLRPDTIELGRTVISEGPEAFNGDPMRFGIGYMLGMSSDTEHDPGEFGHSGYGGQASGAWPTYGAGFAYLTTALRSGTVADRRVEIMLAALHEALENRR